MEIKREMIFGVLSSFKSAMLPVVAAFGGAIAPAIIYLSLNSGTDLERGWGIPMATDIALCGWCADVAWKSDSYVGKNIFNRPCRCR